MLNAPIALREVDAATWDQAANTAQPFVRHQFLQLMEQHGNIIANYGWQPVHQRASDSFAPCYLKSHSWGEFVFDFAWAQSYEHYGLRYYPKLLVASPLTPIPGPRLLCPNDEARRSMAQQLIETASQLQTSSVHINFVTVDDQQALQSTGYLVRRDLHFCWRNRDYASFEDFLAQLRRSRRKNIRRERKKLADHGLDIRVIEGRAATREELDAMFQFYCRTFERKLNQPMLERQWFYQAADLGAVIILAYHNDQAIAGAWYFRDAERLFGRYWGATEDIPGLHFELCYYQGIEYAIKHRLQAFDPGVQGGRHKHPRGFEPRITSSCHYIVDAPFRRAIADSIKRENQYIEQQHEHWRRASPFIDS